MGDFESFLLLICCSLFSIWYEIDFKWQYEAIWNREFQIRLRLGRLLHESFIHPSLASLGVNLCRTFPALGKGFIQATRGEASNQLTALNLPTLVENNSLQTSTDSALKSSANG